MNYFCQYLLKISLFLSLSLKWVDEMADAGANQYTFHLEATGELMNRGYPSDHENYFLRR